MNKTKRFSTDIEVRFRDIDAMGHVNNAVFFTYFEEGRKHFVHQVFGVKGPSDFSFILAHVRCDYLRPIKLNNRVSLEMWVSEIGAKRFNLKYELVDSDDRAVVFASGESVQVCFDYQQNRSTAVSKELREKLDVYYQQD